MFVLALLIASPLTAVGANTLSQFQRTCVASKSKGALVAALDKEGWTIFPTLAQSHLEREVVSLGPILEAQGLASDHTIYGRDSDGQHLELALSETKRPMKDGRKLIGCSLYDFSATAPIDSATVSGLAPAIEGKISALGDVQVETWANAFGDGSGMRSVFVPPTSPIKAQLGFGGMMLGTHFLDATD